MSDDFVTTTGEVCNFCTKTAKYYGKTKSGLRGYMCPDCYKVQGKGQAKRM
jgi:transposase-like protein